MACGRLLALVISPERKRRLIQYVVFLSVLSVHQVVIEKLGKVCKQEEASLPKNVSDYEKSKGRGDRLYMAAAFPRGALNNTRKFVIGDGKSYGGYQNAPLESQRMYKAYIRGVTSARGVRK